VRYILCLWTVISLFHPEGPGAAPATGSWLSRWWKKSDGPGPIKANLGNESDFYFDKDQGRWVNKKVRRFEPTLPP